MGDRRHWLKIGRVNVNPHNPIAMAIARAGEEHCTSSKPFLAEKPIDAERIAAAEAKRARKAARASRG